MAEVASSFDLPPQPVSGRSPDLSSVGGLQSTGARNRRRRTRMKISPLALIVALALLVYYVVIFLIPFGVGI